MLRRLALAFALAIAAPAVSAAQPAAPAPAEAAAPDAAAPDAAAPDAAAPAPAPAPAPEPPPEAEPAPARAPSAAPAGAVAAEPTGEPAPPRRVSGKRRAAAIAAAIVPGVAARGLGSLIVRRPRATRRLLALGGIGLGAAILGGVPLAVTYGSDKVVVPGVHLAVGGAGLIVATWWSDIWVAAGGERLGGRARALPPLAVELGGVWHHDEYLGDRALFAPAIELGRGRLGGRASGLLAADGSAWGARLDGTVTPWSWGHDALGARPGGHTGTALGMRAALQVHGEPGQGFLLATGELAVRGRLELERLEPALRGTFLELEEGLALELAHYDAGATEVTAVLLSRFAWGAYLPGGRGELAVFYDHRRDHLAGGFPAGPAAGFFGSVGVIADVALGGRWHALGQLELGHSLVTTLALRRELRR